VTAGDIAVVPATARPLLILSTVWGRKPHQTVLRIGIPPGSEPVGVFEAAVQPEAEGDVEGHDEAVINPGSTGTSTGQALATLAVYGVIAIVVVAVGLRRRDVTS